MGVRHVDYLPTVLRTLILNMAGIPKPLSAYCDEWLWIISDYTWSSWQLDYETHKKIKSMSKRLKFIENVLFRVKLDCMCVRQKYAECLHEHNKLFCQGMSRDTEGIWELDYKCVSMNKYAGNANHMGRENCTSKQTSLILRF